MTFGTRQTRFFSVTSFEFLTLCKYIYIFLIILIMHNLTLLLYRDTCIYPSPSQNNQPLVCRQNNVCVCPFLSQQKRLQFVSVFGAGLLCGTALAIVLPEGVELLEESWRGEGYQTYNVTGVTARGSNFSKTSTDRWSNNSLQATSLLLSLYGQNSPSIAATLML